MVNKTKVASGISKVINMLHGTDNPQPLKEGSGYSTEGAGVEIKKTPQQKEVVKKKVNEHLIWDLLEQMGKNFASGSGLITSQILSGITNSTEKQEEKPEKSRQQALGVLLTGNTQSKKSEAPQNKRLNNPEISKISPGEDNPLKKNESEADVLAKTYILMRKHQKWVERKEKSDKKYRKKLDKQKELFLDETIAVFTGKKTSTMRKMQRSMRANSGFLKTGLKVALGIGGLLVAKDALANIDWDKKFKDTFSDFKFPEFDFGGKNETLESQSRVGKNTKEGDYWNKMYGLIYKEAKEQGFENPDIVASLGATQSALETGHGKHLIGGTAAFGVKGKGTIAKTQEYENGKMVTKEQEFQKYDTLEDSVKGYVGVLKQKNFAGVGKAKTVPEAIDAVVAGKYATAPNYGETLNKTYESVTKPKENMESKELGSLSKISGITSGFGKRWGKEHGGVDLPGKTGDAVASTAPGKIIRAGWEDPNNHNKGYGQFVEIQHENGTLTRYGHLSKIDVNPGEMVESGQKIGEVGSTGHSTGPHLHYEVLKDGKKIDPTQSGAFNLNPVMPESKLSSSDMKYRETQNIKKQMETNGQQVAILNNNTNAFGGGTTYLISQENVSTYSPVTKQQFNYLS